jgi:hypothetical protein
MAHMNLDYWEEQINATLVTAAHLAVPITNKERVYLPVLLRSYREQEEPEPNPGKSGCFRDRALLEGR